MYRNAPTKLGMTSGSAASTVHTLRNGKSDLSVSHAKGMAMTADRVVTQPISRSVRQSVSSVRTRNSRSHAWSLALAPLTSRYTTGSAMAAPTSKAGTSAGAGGKSSTERRRREISPQPTAPTLCDIRAIDTICRQLSLNCDLNPLI